MKRKNFIKHIAAAMICLMTSMTPAFAESLSLSENAVFERFSGQEVVMSGRCEIHLSDASPLENSSVDIKGEDAWLFFDAVKPSVVMSEYLKDISIDGVAANIEKNVRVVLYKNGSVVIPHGFEALEKALTVYTGPNCTGESMDFAAYTKSGDLGDFDNNIRSFRLKRGFQVCFANNPDATGHSRVYIADREDLIVNEMPEGFVTKDGSDKSFVSFIKVESHQWPNKKMGWSKFIADKINANNYYFSYQVKSLVDEYLSPDVEFVYEHARNYYTPDAYCRLVGDLIGMSHAIGAIKLDTREDTLEIIISPEMAIQGWPYFLKSGLRTGAPTGSEKDWNKRFFEIADSVNYRVDFATMMQANFHNENITKKIDNVIKLANGRPIWITEMGLDYDYPKYAADPTGPKMDAEFNIIDNDIVVSGPHSPANSAQYIELFQNAVSEISQHPKVERFCYIGGPYDAQQIMLNNKFTPLGTEFQEMEADLAYNPDQEFEHLWHIAPPFVTTNLSIDRKTFNLSWYDHNGETGKC